MHRITRDHYVLAYDAQMTPVLEVDPGETVLLELNDCFCGQVHSEADTADTVDESLANPATGPISVRGAEPGDTLVVELLAIRPGPVGCAMVEPGEGQLGHLVDAPVTRLFQVSDGTVRLGDRLSFPARPMVGVIGVATGGEHAPTMAAGEHGGNLDDNLNGPGATVLLPVRQAGAMLAIGDMHAAMGDGEVCGTGVEIDGEVEIRVGLLKGVQTRWPVTVTDTHWVTHGTAVEDLMGAVDAAVQEAGTLLVDQWGLDVADAFAFLSVACDAGIAQAVHPSTGTVIAKMAVPRVEACPYPFRVG